MRQDVVVHADAGVAHAEGDQRSAGAAGASGIAPRGPAPRHVGRGEGERAAGRHRVARVDAEVGDHLLQLPRVGDHLAQRGVEIEPELDPLADDPPQHAAHLVHDRR